MKPVNSKSRSRNALLFIFSLLAVAGIGYVLYNSMNKLPGGQIDLGSISKVAGSGKRDAGVLMAGKQQLDKRLEELKELDDAFLDLQISSVANKNFDSLNKLITVTEENFHKSIDSLGRQWNVEKDDNSELGAIIGTYTAALESRKPYSSLRNVISISQSNLTPDQKAVFNIQEDMLAKTRRITTLEAELANLQKGIASTPSLVSNKQNEKFADSVKFVAAINVLENKVASLTANVNTLKDENERLEKQQSDNNKNAGSNETALRDKATSLQQRIESLNADLQLAYVDCNLNRVDATQIISTAKQRKQLLNEASSILTNLSVSGSSEVKRKVQQKIARLNQVAANSRD